MQTHTPDETGASAHEPSAHAASAADAGQVTLDSMVLGRIAVPEETIYAFPAGLIGLEERQRFALLPSEREGVLWLVSADDPSLTFVVADPFRAAPGYTADIPDAELAALGPATPDDLLVLAVLTLGGNAEPTTANLRAPLVFNVATRRARQVVLPDDRYTVAHPVEI